MTIEDHHAQASPIGSSRWQSILWIGGIALIYFLVARLSLSFTFEPEGIAAIWPPAGIFLSAVLLTRRNIRPYLIALLFFTDLAAEVLAGTPLIVSLIYAAALTGDATLSAWLLRRFVGEQITFRQVSQVIGFLLLCLLLSNALMSVVAALAAAIYLQVPFWSSWLWWWSSDGVGSLLVTPLIMSLAFAIKTRFAGIKKSQIVEGAVLFLLTAFLSNYAFANFLDDSWFILLLNLFIFPFLLWASLRFGVIGAAITSAILALTILQYAIAGAFAHLGIDSNLEAIILVQVYIAMAAIPAILLAALITERKQAEESLKTERTFLSAVLDNVEEAIVTCNAHGQLTRFNQSARRLHGLPEQPIPPEQWAEHYDLYHADGRTPLSTEHIPLFRALQGERVHEAEIVIAPKNSNPHFLVCNGQQLTNEAGTISGAVVAMHDITEHKHTEEDLRQSQEMLAQAERISNTGSWNYEVASDTAAWSANMFRLFDVGPEIPNALVFKYFVEHVVHPDDRDHILDVFQRALEGKCEYDLEYRIIWRDGTMHVVHALAQILRESDGRPSRMIGWAQDITERWRAEEAVRERNNYIETILENAPIGFAINTIHDGKGEFVSSKFEKIYGVPRGTINTVDEYFEKVYLDPVFREQIRERIMTDMASGDAARMRWENIPITTIKGEHKVVTAINIPLLDRNLMVSTVQDVTERWRAEEALKENEERLRLALAAANQGLYDTNLRTRKSIVSPEYATILGYDPATFHETTAFWIERLHPDDRERVLKNFQAYINGELSAYTSEFRQRTRSGGWKWTLSVGKIVAWDAEGKPLRMLGTHTDITERKRAEQLLKSLNTAALVMQRALTPSEVFIAAADELKKIGYTCAVFATDPDRRRLILKHNSFPAPIVHLAEVLLQVSAEGFSLPLEPSDAIRKAIRDKQSIFVAALEDDIRQQFPEPFNRLAGPLVKILNLPKLILAPLVVEDEVVGILFVLSDDLHENDMSAITAFAHQMAVAWRKSQLLEQARQEIAARKQAEDQVRQLNAELEQRVVDRTAQLETANKELEAFAYSVSHDLRAPLRAIDGYTRILLEDHSASLDAEGKRVGTVISDNTRRMGQLIDDLLAFSRLSRADMQSAVIEMETLVRSVYHELTPPADRQRIDFRVNALPVAFGDRTLIRQVWVNLLSNAIKFSSKRARAIIEVDSQPSGDETVYLVRDNGAGFDMQYRHKLFGVFQRLHSGREFEGTGVGLAIVQRVIHRHGGRVWGEGTVDQGATFYFTLPRKGI